MTSPDEFDPFEYASEEGGEAYAGILEIIDSGIAQVEEVEKERDRARRGLVPGGVGGLDIQFKQQQKKDKDKAKAVKKLLNNLREAFVSLGKLFSLFAEDLYKLSLQFDTRHLRDSEAGGVLLGGPAGGEEGGC